jgi:hypothetical protein
MTKHRPVSCLFMAAISVGFAGILSFSAQAETSHRRPVFFYEDSIVTQIQSDMLEDNWNKVWKFPARLKGQEIHNCSDLEKALDGKPYSHDVDREVGYDGFCPLVTMQARISRPRRALFDADRPDKDIYEHLDISTLHWGDLDARLGRKGPYTLAQLSLKKVYLYTNQVSFDLGERGYQINILILADFEGDGEQQIFCDLRYYDNKTGERASFPVLLTREKKGGVIVAKPVYVKKPVSFKLPQDVLDNMDIRDPKYMNQ